MKWIAKAKVLFSAHFSDAEHIHLSSFLPCCTALFWLPNLNVTWCAGELEYPAFVELMILTLSQKASEKGEMADEAERQEGMQTAMLPFEVVAIAYRRLVY